MMPIRTTSWIPILLLLLSGCADGPLWRTGHLSPWVRQRWTEEARVYNTLEARKRQITTAVDGALNASPDEQAKISSMLAETIARDPVLLVRIHAVRELSRLPNTPAVTDALVPALRDPQPDVRKAAISALATLGGPTAATRLQEVAASDTNLDVRLLATAELGRIDSADAVKALDIMLSDPNPAVQYRAMRSLKKITGEKFGANVADWQKYIAANFRSDSNSRGAVNPSNRSLNPAEPTLPTTSYPGPTERTANLPDAGPRR